MSSVYDISSMYDSYKQSVQSATGSKAQSALNAVNSDSTDEELMDACKGFETYFVQKISHPLFERIFSKTSHSLRSNLLKHFMVIPKTTVSKASHCS